MSSKYRERKKTQPTGIIKTAIVFDTVLVLKVRQMFVIDWCTILTQQVICSTQVENQQ